MDTVYFTKMKIALSNVDHLILLIEFCRNAEKPEISHMQTNTYGLLLCLQIKLTLLALTSNFLGGGGMYFISKIEFGGHIPGQMPGIATGIRLSHLV